MALQLWRVNGDGPTRGVAASREDYPTGYRAGVLAAVIRPMNERWRGEALRRPDQQCGIDAQR
jgi:hypothetical protein